MHLTFSANDNGNGSWFTTDTHRDGINGRPPDDNLTVIMQVHNAVATIFKKKMDHY